MSQKHHEKAAQHDEQAAKQKMNFLLIRLEK